MSSHVSEGNIGVPLPFANTEIFYPGKHAAERGKAYCAMSPLLPFFILLPDEHSRNFCNSCAWKEKFRNREAQKTSEDASPELEKDENPRELPFDGWRAWYKYSSIEVTAEGGETWLRSFRMIKIAFDFSAEAFHLIKSVGGESLKMNVRELFAVLESAGKDKEQRFGAVGKAETYKSSP